MKLVDTIISNTGEAKIVLTVPLPRYVLVACCDDTSHVSNRQDPDFLREISGSEKSLSDAAAAGKRTEEARILNVLEFFGPLESPLQELTTVDGTSIWAGNGVHLTSNATRVTAMKMMAYIIGGETAEPVNKRARLESVIPVRPTPLPAAKPVQPAPPLPPGLYRPRSGCPASCRPTNTATHIHEASSAGGQAANSSRKEANPDPREWPPPPKRRGQRRASKRPPWPLGPRVARKEKVNKLSLKSTSLKVIRHAKIIGTSPVYICDFFYLHF
jgi:hypothetical protein